MATAAPKLAEYRRKRDFDKTREPSGNTPVAERGALRFVIQKHAASHLHFDFRLELDGVMKSWAVPKGPSTDPTVKRLAMEVEDHPIAYNTFEGTIPKGEYGGGTVMLWDRGTYSAPGLSGAESARTLREDYKKGRMHILLDGERLHGEWLLFRTRFGSSDKPQWLLAKHNDGDAVPGTDVVADHVTSVDSGRTMEEIAAGQRVWHSNRDGGDDSGAPAISVRTRAEKTTAAKTTRRSTGTTAAKAKRKTAPKTALSTTRQGTSKAVTKSAGRRAERAEKTAASTRTLKLPAIVPMKASVGTAVPAGDGWTFEPKYDGIRVIAYATPADARVVTRNGNDKSTQFPEVVAALRTLSSKARRPLVLDGEIVAIHGGEVARFQDLQSRMHTKNTDFIESAKEGSPAALMVFDLLVDGGEVLLGQAWSARRALLEQRLRNRTSAALRLGESVPNDGDALLEKAGRLGWEGVIAKRMDAPYVPGDRSRAWLKLKIEHRQEFVVGGWTEPRNTREHIGALLLGYFDGDEFIYVGHTGGGFTREGLKEMHQRLAKLERAKPPFTSPPKTNERAHWVTPKVVVEVKFGEWTADGKLRQPIFLGVRDDKPAREVGREAESVQDRVTRRDAGTGVSASVKRPVKSPSKRRTASAVTSKATSAPKGGVVLANASVVERLREIEESGGKGEVKLGSKATLAVSSLGKVYFPKDGVTKGALMRYYAGIAPLILPTLRDRPLVLKRTPEGIDGETFFQQKAPEHAPPVVRIEKVEEADGDKTERIIGGDLPTLLYTVQLGCVSTDPWHARVGSLEHPDYTVLDLDPGPKAGFVQVLDVARWVKDELETLGLGAALKTSGSRGLHIYIPLPTSASWDTALTLAQLIATRVATAHPRVATVERSVAARPPGTIYVDYLQNVRGKSVAGAYCVRAKPGATVSTPLDWRELTDDLDPHAFTIDTAPLRFAKKGDLWNPVMKSRNTAAALRAATEAASVR
jgi:bifunctional non-homologous end joining protein LigD